MSWLGQVIRAWRAGLRGENLDDWNDLEWPDLNNGGAGDELNDDSGAAIRQIDISLIGNLLVKGTTQIAADSAIAVAQEGGWDYRLVDASAFGPMAELTAELTGIMPGHLLILMNIQTLPPPFVECLIHALENQSILVRISSNLTIEVPIYSFPIFATCTNIDYCSPKLLAHFPVQLDAETGLIETIDREDIPDVSGPDVNLNDPRSMSSDAALLLLGLAPGTSVVEIRQAYRRKIAEWHPDKLEGMASELKVFATERMKMLNAAYELLMIKPPVRPYADASSNSNG